MTILTYIGAILIPDLRRLRNKECIACAMDVPRTSYGNHLIHKAFNEDDYDVSTTCDALSLAVTLRLLEKLVSETETIHR